MTILAVSASISAENTFTDWFDPSETRRVQSMPTKFNVSISGSFSGTTVTLQRRFGASGSAVDVKNYTAAAEEIAEEIEDDVQYRLGVKTGNYSAGPAVCRLSF